ncbi:carbamoyltransferase [Streptomyces phyllanthi]|uniref:Carbamoyltransferase n=1 Tax=Streptomyces phyllanthi TaxID=1803180 RepID=A0A5N8W474_9ACTN|nr:carbamoyltransferase C-terminal domain-containing protein [Streptomyces phyllanthi]MPY41104.1 carbamoyltransferase [Streptomyces phyllanthi]
MIVLGYNGFSRAAELYGSLYGHTPDSVDRHQLIGHDAAAALIVDGRLVAAVEEERLNRQKKTSAFPVNAIRWVLDEAGLTFDDVDRFAFGWNHSDAYAQALIGDVAGAPMAAEDKLRVLRTFGELYLGALGRGALIEDFTRHTGYALPDEKLVTVPHHRAHLACGRMFSGLGDTAFLINDGTAERDSTIMGEIRDGEVTVFDRFTVDANNSVAQLFGAITRYLGFVPNNDEYKVMGLAGFGPAPADNPLLGEIVTLEPDGRYSLRNPGRRGPDAYDQLLDKLFGGTDDNRHTFEHRVRVACAAQHMVETVTAHQLAALAEATALRHLVFEGGLALNCVNNTKLLEGSPFQRLEVSFGASDPGVSIGAAAHVAYREHRTVEPGNAPYTGPEYGTDAIREVLERHSAELTWEELPTRETVARTAELLARRAVVGWFQGRTEFGPRALGNRSILADPSCAEMKDIINERVKHREQFRPFAPIVLEEDAARVFALGKKRTSPYMTFVFPVRQEYVDTIAAATHVDATSRVQTVTDEGNPLLAGLLREFKARTGVPCLVNTSFNVAGEPIVCSPQDAVACFLGTDIDHLVIGDFVVSKRQ